MKEREQGHVLEEPPSAASSQQRSATRFVLKGFGKDMVVRVNVATAHSMATMPVAHPSTHKSASSDPSAALSAAAATLANVGPSPSKRARTTVSEASNELSTTSTEVSSDSAAIKAEEPEDMSHPALAARPGYPAETVHQVAQSLRECIKFLLPPNWVMTSDEIDMLTLAGLSLFPVDDFVEHYRSQMQAFAEFRLSDAETRVSDAEANLKDLRKAQEKLRGELAELQALQQSVSRGVVAS
jgi:hypothetical protein